MKIQVTATDESYFKVNKAFHSRSNYKDSFTSMLNDIPCTDMDLTSVRSCLAIGPADGEGEVEFVKHCAPNIGKFLAIEPDHESVRHLRTFLGTSLPGANSRVFETTLQKWEGLSDPVDLILMFQCLYYFEDDERRELFKNMHDQWLTSGGYVAVAAISRNNSSRFDELLGIPWLQWQDIESDLEKAGFAKLFSYEMHATKDLTNPDETLLKYYLSADDVLVRKYRSTDGDDVDSTIISGHGKGRKGGNMDKALKRYHRSADDGTDGDDVDSTIISGHGKGRKGGNMDKALKRYHRSVDDGTDGDDVDSTIISGHGKGRKGGNMDKALKRYHRSADDRPRGKGRTPQCSPKGGRCKRDIPVAAMLNEIRDSIKLLPNGKADDFHMVAVFKRVN